MRVLLVSPSKSILQVCVEGLKVQSWDTTNGQLQIVCGKATVDSVVLSVAEAEVLSRRLAKAVAEARS